MLTAKDYKQFTESWEQHISQIPVLAMQAKITVTEYEAVMAQLREWIHLAALEMYADHARHED